MSLLITTLKSVPVLLAIVLFAIGCGSPRPEKGSMTQPGQGLTISRLSSEVLACAPNGDKEYAWAWRHRGKSLYLVHKSGRLTSINNAFLGDRVVDHIVPIGDKEHGLVVPSHRPEPKLETEELFILSKSATAALAQRVSLDSTPEETTPVEDGVWIFSSRLQNERSSGKAFFLRANSLELSKVWDTSLGDRQPPPRIGHYYINGSEQVDTTRGTDWQRIISSAKLSLRLYDPLNGSAEGPLLMPRLHAIPPGGYSVGAPVEITAIGANKAWLAPQIFSGLALIDAKEAFQRYSKRQSYSPSIFLPGQRVNVRVASPQVSWAFPLARIGTELDYSKPTGAYILRPSKKPDGLRHQIVTPLAEEHVHEIVPLNSEACLVQIGSSPGEDKVIYITAPGKTRLVTEKRILIENRSSFIIYGQKGWSVFPDSDKSGFILWSQIQGIYHFDKNSLQLTELAGPQDYPDIPQILTDNGKLWMNVHNFNNGLRGLILYDRINGTILNRWSPLFPTSPKMPKVTPFGDGRRALVSVEGDGTFLVDLQANQLPILIEAGKAKLGSAHKTPTTAAFDPNVPNPDIQITLTGWSKELLHRGAKIRIEISTNGTKGKSLALETPEIKTTHKVNLTYATDHKRRFIPFNVPCTVKATLTDSLGSRVTWEWSNIRFIHPLPLVKRPWFLSLAVFGLLLGIAVVGTRWGGGAQRWIPLVAIILGSGQGLFPGIKDYLHLPLLYSLIIGSLFLGLVTGVLAPRVFRELQPVEPFRTMSPLALKLPWIRRRLFSTYVQRVKDDLTQARKNANDEVYSPVPMATIGARRAYVETNGTPPSILLQLLTTNREENRANILIESPGGRGKSALVRETVLRALSAFTQKPGQPLPILCEGDGESLFSLAKRSLGTQGFSEELVRSLMRDGEFFLVVDGITESSITANMIRGYTAEFDTKCPLLVAGRPNDAIRRAIENTTSWLIVEPVRLDDKTLDTFISAYGGHPGQLGEELRRACQSSDGTYLPILIRLALLTLAENPRSVSEVYRSAVRQLLKGDNALFDATANLCYDTYWKDGERRLPYATVPKERKELLKTLLAAGLIIPADIGPIRPEEPRTVQFFHDSIQSYMTAVSLAQRNRLMKSLMRAAGADLFVRDRSDLLLAGTGSELFQMCLYVFEPQQTVRDAMRATLLECSQRFTGSFSRDWVVEASRMPGLEAVIQPETPGGKALLTAIDAANEQADMSFLGNLYARVIRFLWPKLAGSIEESSTESKD